MKRIVMVLAGLIASLAFLGVPSFSLADEANSGNTGGSFADQVENDGD